MNGPARPAAAPTMRRGASRVAFLVIGLLAVGLGGVGIVVPGLPTTVFFIIAASCFARSSTRFERWVLDLPKVGRLVRDHRDGLGMPRRAKVIALAMMWTAIVLSSLTLRRLPVVVAAVLVLGLVGTAYIAWRVPTRERVLLARKEFPAGDEDGVTPGTAPADPAAGRRERT